jgi:hypothetical protein
MTAGTCLEHPHHEALLQFAQVPRMHMVVMLFSIAVEGGVGEWRFRGAENGGLASIFGVRQSRNQIHCPMIMGMAKI